MSDDPQQTQSAPPRLQDLPAAWTILECVAWIALRDTAVVRDAAAETERPAGTFVTQVKAPDGSLEAASVAGEAGYSPIRLSLEWAYRNATNEAPFGPAPNEARQDLLTKLRASRLTATGTPSDGTGQRAMTAADWRGLVFVTRDRILQAEPDRLTGQVWRDVIMARDDVVHEWPPVTQTNGQVVPRAKQQVPRVPLGRPPKHNWQPFKQELCRLLLLDGGYGGRGDLFERMKRWADENMPTNPDDRTIEKIVAELVPRGGAMPD